MCEQKKNEIPAHTHQLTHVAIKRKICSFTRIQTDEAEIGSVAAEAASKIDDLIRHDNGDEEIEDVDDIDAITGVAIVSI